MRHHLHADRENRIEKEESGANSDYVGEIAFGCRCGEAVSTEAEQNDAEASGQIGLDQGEHELDGDDHKCRANHEGQKSADKGQFEVIE